MSSATLPSLIAIAEALNGRKEGSSYRCECPLHNGRSLIVTENNAKILFNCKSGCPQGDVLAALKERGLWPSTNGHQEDGGEPLERLARQRMLSASTLRDKYGVRVAAGPSLLTTPTQRATHTLSATLSAGLGRTGRRTGGPKVGPFRPRISSTA